MNIQCSNIHTYSHCCGDVCASIHFISFFLDIQLEQPNNEWMNEWNRYRIEHSTLSFYYYYDYKMLLGFSHFHWYIVVVCILYFFSRWWFGSISFFVCLFVYSHFEFLKEKRNNCLFICPSGYSGWLAGHFILKNVSIHEWISHFFKNSFFQTTTKIHTHLSMWILKKNFFDYVVIIVCVCVCVCEPVLFSKRQHPNFGQRKPRQPNRPTKIKIKIKNPNCVTAAISNRNKIHSLYTCHVVCVCVVYSHNNILYLFFMFCWHRKLKEKENILSIQNIFIHFGVCCVCVCLLTRFKSILFCFFANTNFFKVEINKKIIEKFIFFFIVQRFIFISSFSHCFFSVFHSCEFHFFEKKCI